jgi:uncharacterized protein (DUF1697 family)
VATYAALLRNINVGGKRIAMADLRRVFADAGCSAIATYAQSGNVVFRSRASPGLLAADLEARVAAVSGFTAPVLLRTREELAAVITRDPWAGEPLEPTQMVVVFCRSDPPAEGVAGLRDLAVDGEEVVASGRELYLRLPRGQGRSKLAAAISRAGLGGPVTARNRRTVTSLVELAESVARGGR